MHCINHQTFVVDCFVSAVVLRGFNEPVYNDKKVSPNTRGTKSVFSDIRVLSIQIYLLSLSCLAMGINLVRDKQGVRDWSKMHFVHHKRKKFNLNALAWCIGKVPVHLNILSIEFIFSISSRNSLAIIFTNYVRSNAWVSQ